MRREGGGRDEKGRGGGREGGMGKGMEGEGMRRGMRRNHWHSHFTEWLCHGNVVKALYCFLPHVGLLEGEHASDGTRR